MSVLSGVFCNGIAGCQAQLATAEEAELPSTDGKVAAASRAYDEGPLKAAEFKAQPPASLPTSKSGTPLLAATLTELHYSTDYRFRVVRSRYYLSDFKVRVFATFLVEKSWNAAPDDVRLLEHEQGHFDLTEIFARRAQQRIDKLIKKGRIKGAGPDEVTAHEAALKLIKRELALVVDEWNAEQKRYDEETQHGTHPTVQAKWRKQIDDELRGMAGDK